MTKFNTISVIILILFSISPALADGLYVDQRTDRANTHEFLDSLASVLEGEVFFAVDPIARAQYAHVSRTPRLTLSHFRDEQKYTHGNIEQTLYRGQRRGALGSSHYFVQLITSARNLRGKSVSTNINESFSGRVEGEVYEITVMGLGLCYGFGLSGQLFYDGPRVSSRNGNLSGVGDYHCPTVQNDGGEMGFVIRTNNAYAAGQLVANLLSMFPDMVLN